jgi:hypothetical protein
MLGSYCLWVLRFLGSCCVIDLLHGVCCLIGTTVPWFLLHDGFCDVWYCLVGWYCSAWLDLLCYVWFLSRMLHGFCCLMGTGYLGSGWMMDSVVYGTVCLIGTVLPGSYRLICMLEGENEQPGV